MYIVINIIFSLFFIPILTAVVSIVWMKKNLTTFVKRLLQLPKELKEIKGQETAKRKEWLRTVLSSALLLFLVYIPMVCIVVWAWISLTIPMALDVPHLIQGEYNKVEGVVVHDSPNIIIIATDRVDESEERQFDLNRRIPIDSRVKIYYLPNTKEVVSLIRLESRDE